LVAPALFLWFLRFFAANIIGVLWKPIKQLAIQ
jgi:hypothetical protein